MREIMTKINKIRELWKKNILLSTAFALLVMVVVQGIIFFVLTGSFSGMLEKLGIAWLNILRNNTYAGIIALGMCFAIISGGIDLSVGSMLCALGAILMYLIEPTNGLLASMGITGAAAYGIAIVMILICGCLLGALNGTLVAYGKLPPFIATLGTMKIFRSVTQQVTKQFNPKVPDGFKLIASFKIGGQVVLPVIYWLVIVLVMILIFRKTAFGRQTVAIGSNERAAKLSGINVQWVKTKIYMLVGLMCSIASVIYIARIGSMDFANAGSGYEMDAIAAVVVGGTAMSGGKGSIGGAFLGMLIIGAMNNILNSVGVPTFLCEAVKGAIIILAVIFQRKENA